MPFSTYYDSTDTGLAGLTNVAGSLLTFLDAVLVNGYNSKTLTSLICVGTTVTATLVSHGYRDRQFVTISGATPTGYNGTWQIIPGSTSSNTFQFTILSSGLSAATGTLACIVAPLGYTTEFTGTNLRAYQAPSGNRLPVRIDDTGTTTARFLGYETMSDVNTGVNGFPLATQVSGGNFWSKSSAVTARRTILWGNSSVFHCFTDYTGDSSSGTLMSFGDATPTKSGDAWCTYIFGSSAAGDSSGNTVAIATASVSALGAINTHYFVRSFSQLAGAVTAGKVADSRFSNTTVTAISAGVGAQIGSGSNGPLTFPMPVDGNAWTSQVTLTEATQGPRGYMQGVYAPLHARAFTNYTIYQGAGSLAGREVMAINLGATGQILAEVSNTF